jgi:hypothetical protein
MRRASEAALHAAGDGWALDGARLLITAPPADVRQGRRVRILSRGGAR